jgi:hypothetical protein
MSEAAAEARFELSEWLRWPMICVWTPDEAVIIDIARIEEDEATRRACRARPRRGSFVQARRPHQRQTTSRPAALSRGAFAGSVTAFLRAEAGCIELADDLLAFIRE